MNRLLRTALLLLIPALTACNSGDDGGGGPTSPPPNQNVNIAGVWVGTATSLSASGTCLADLFQPLAVSVRWNISQIGPSFVGDQTLNNAVTCPFRGTVAGNTATFFPQSSQSSCVVQNSACNQPLRPVRMELRLDIPIQTATVNGNLMTATGITVWRVFDAQTGTSLGELQIRTRQDLQR